MTVFDVFDWFGLVSLPFGSVSTQIGVDGGGSRADSRARYDFASVLGKDKIGKGVTNVISGADPVAESFAALGRVVVIVVSEVDRFIEVVVEKGTDVSNLSGGSFMRGAAIQGRTRHMVEQFAYIVQA